MTDKKHEDLPAWESQVNALLDSELDESSTEALKQAAQEDHELARAIIEAFQLQRSMDTIGIERAPASLRRKLRGIPRNNRQSLSPRRWIMATAMASIPLLAIGLVLMQPRQPSQADVEQARQDLACAAAVGFERPGDRRGTEIFDNTIQSLGVFEIFSAGDLGRPAGHTAVVADGL